MVELCMYTSLYEYMLYTIRICYCRARRRPMVDVAVIHTYSSTYDVIHSLLISIVIVMCCCRS